MNRSTNQPSLERSNLYFLDGLRGVAAIYVMVGHARWLLWEGYENYLQHAEVYNLLDTALMYFFALFRFGHQAVLFFFVLSGFVIHLKFAYNLTQPSPVKFMYSQYFLRRFRRIYPPFFFSLLITLVLDFYGKHLGFLIYSGNTPYPLINSNIGFTDASVQTFIGNLFFLYSEYVPVFGTNGPAWSLKFEWWFYVLYPVFLLMGTRSILYPTILIIFFFLASFFPAYWPERLLPNVFSMMVTWWFGVILAEVYTRRISASFKLLSVIAFVLWIIPFWKVSNNTINDVRMAVAFFSLMAFFFSLSPNSWLIRKIKKLKILGDFSYTLYIIHFPIVVFISGWIMSINGGYLPSHFLYVFGGIFLVVAFSYVTHFFTELYFSQRKI